MDNAKTSATKYAILRYSARGRSYYQSREVGSVTRLRSSVWTTPDRQAAAKLCYEVGGTVIDMEAP